MMPNLNPNDLVIFYAVAREKSLSAAAEKLFLTQPAITYHIQSLEQYTGVKLIDFKKRQIVLTHHGQELLRYAAEIYHQLTDAERFIQFIKESRIRVGIASVYDVFMRPLLNSMFVPKNPEIKLTIKSGDSFDMVKNVEESALDLAIVPQFNYDMKNLNHFQVSNPEKIVCFASSHQEIKKKTLDWKDLLDYPLVIGTELSVVRKLIISKFKEKGLPEPPLAAEVGSVIWSKSLVENGKGLSFTLAKDIQKEVLEGRLKIVPLKDPAYITAEAITSVDVLNPIIEEFIQMVKEVFNYKDPKDSSTTARENSLI
jgi:LysR family transcriptional regulator, low CO2-responsive transcriptional regulator